MKWQKHLFTIILLLFVAGLLLRPGGCRPAAQQGAARPPNARIVELAVEGRPAPGEPLAPYSFIVRAEVADTTEKRRQGLVGRRELEPGSGMLYVYREPQRPEFTEAAIPFPLALAFLSADGTILDIERTRANDPSTIEPAEPISYMLEVRGGWFEDRGIRRGARFLLPAELTEGQEPPTAEPPASEEAT